MIAARKQAPGAAPARRAERGAGGGLPPLPVEAARATRDAAPRAPGARRAGSAPRARRHTGAAVEIARRIRDARVHGPVRPRLVVLERPSISLDRVGTALTAGPSRRMLLAALVVALGTHALLADWSLGLRPHKARPRSVEMVVAAVPEEPLAEEPLAEPEPEPAEAASSPGPGADTPAAPSAPADTRTSAAGPPAPSGLGAGLGNDFGGGLGGGLGLGAGGGAGTRGASRTQPGSAAGGEPSKRAPRVIAPRALRRPPPEYPRRARAQQVEGYVALQLLVGTDGAVRDVRVVDAQPAGVFEGAAVAAVRRWSFSPGRTDDAPSEAWVRQTVRFTLSSS